MNDIQKQVIKEKVQQIGKKELEKKMKELPNILNSAMESILFSFIGLKKDKWSDAWELDQSNGRRSLIDDFIKNKMREQATEWIKQKSWPTFTLATSTMLRSYYIKEKDRFITEELRDLAQEDAQRYVEDLISEGVTNYIEEIK